MTEIERQLHLARQSLLDLTLRNQLLNFRPSSRRSIRIIDEIPSEVYQILAIDQKTMRFLGKKRKEEVHVNENGQIEVSSGLTKEETKKLWKLPDVEIEVSERHTDKYLQTELTKEALQKRLFYIYKGAESILEEQGYTVLYLALGFLEWADARNRDKKALAPLVLVPVELSRKKVGASFGLSWSGEDFITNISLAEKLKEQGVLLPEFEMPEEKTGIDSYFQSVVNAMKSHPDWQVLSEVHLGFFSFTKFVMYMDLDPETWPDETSPADHPLIKEIFDPSPDSLRQKGFDENEIDEKLHASELFHVMDADPSQIATIEDVKSGMNLVVEGPPGTGKSQTISNMIAELLSAGKSVLFVSEKMAALEVVKSRLDHIGLGEFCLELHSRKSKKKEFLKEMQRSIENYPPKGIELAKHFKELENLKSNLNAYAKALRVPYGKIARTPFSLFCSKEDAVKHFIDNNRKACRISFKDPKNWTQSQLTDAEISLKNVSEALELVAPIKVNPWKGCYPGTVLPSDQEEVEELLAACKSGLEDLKSAIDGLIRFTQLKAPETLADLSKCLSVANTMLLSSPIGVKVITGNDWPSEQKKANQLIEVIEKNQALGEDVLSRFKEEALDEDIKSLLSEYKVRSVKLFRIFSGRYRALKREIFELYKTDPPRQRHLIRKDLSRLQKYIKERNDIRDSASQGEKLFGSYWDLERSNPDKMRPLVEWIVKFHQFLRAGIATDGTAEVISEGFNKDELKSLISSVVAKAKGLIEKRNELLKKLGTNFQKLLNKKASDVSLNEFSSLINKWSGSINRLQRWGQFLFLLNKCKETVAEPMIPAIYKDEVVSEDILQCFHSNVSDQILKDTFNDYPILASFVGELHEKKIHRFSVIDREIIACNRQRLAHKLFHDRPAISGGASRGSEAGILLGEFSRKRGHMPIRKLITKTGRLIQKIKPCFMMSPLSIAQFLDPRAASFDVIIFDEASQVRPQDALGALLRGTQVVVLGDTRQLPPTRFFDHVIEAQEEDEEFDESAPVSDVESILHLCKRSFPTKVLSWHYRSRHESLIAVSNQEFYDNRLLIYPSSLDKSDALGLKFVYLPEAKYDRGRSSINRYEAREVAKAAMEHYTNFPDKSLGIGTFNVKQQKAIEEEIELQLMNNPELGDYFERKKYEYCFVKNLETIQGDERDVIFISVCYGFDDQGRFSRNFGPVNHAGGERRLNVLITRAREKTVVFSNFRASDLAVDATSPFGVRSFKVFLDYAENRNLKSYIETGQDTDSPFEDSVYEFLRDSGFEVRKQVGCAGFRIDLAIVDPGNPGRYLLAVECDGAKYHSSRVARDRDRLRQQVLENLGWHIYRIWSTDWYRNRKECRDKLYSYIRNLIDQGTGTHHSKKNSPVKAPTRKIERMKRKKRSKSGDCIEDEIDEYDTCMSLNIPSYEPIHRVSPWQLAKAVTKVVEAEGPICEDELIRRIRVLWGLGRAGKRVKDAIYNAIKVAIKDKMISTKGKFLWPRNQGKCRVRRRYNDPSPKIELICDQEIAEAVRLVLKYQFSTAREDLINRTAKLFGFHAVHDNTSNKIGKVIRKMIKGNVIENKPNGMIYFVESD
ncbi:MAG: DUF3320 domain-containing protein [Planctomycetota bacterium]|nr:MAG: DUF3320 domain-containing protein [Planctomycetota bacterium]